MSGSIRNLEREYSCTVRLLDDTEYTCTIQVSHLSATVFGHSAERPNSAAIVFDLADKTSDCLSSRRTASAASMSRYWKREMIDPE